MLITARDGDHRGYGVIGFRLHECRRSAQASRGVRLPVIPSRGWAGMKRCGSGRVTSNLPFGRWAEVFGDEIVAAAMIDRLVHQRQLDLT